MRFPPRSAFPGVMRDTTPTPQKTIPRPFFSWSSHLYGAKLSLLEESADTAKPIMHCTVLLLFIPLFFFSEFSDYWKASNTKGEHKAKVGLFICLGPLNSQKIWNKRALLNPRERACFSVNALTFSLALTCFKAYIWHKLICRVFSHFPSAAGAN